MLLKLKLIKTYLNSTMSQIRPSSLAILSIDSQRLDDAFIDMVIETFADNKARSKSF